MHTDPAKAGFDPARLERITAHLERNYIESGKIPGCQVAVSRHGQPAYFRSFGNADREREQPVTDDTIFRIYSMTKPITSVALMTLYEQGHFQLSDPVHRFIPEWRNQRVWVSGEGDSMETKVPDPPMTPCPKTSMRTRMTSPPIPPPTWIPPGNPPPEPPPPPCCTCEVSSRTLSLKVIGPSHHRGEPSAPPGTP